MIVKIAYKSGNITTTDLNITAEELADRLTNNKIDISPTLSVIKWSEVESISMDKTQKTEE